ncbi:Do family serine endopeptidase [Opitutus sp. ER46]|uniref:Do family serine endopeptidase n=1 Tax=Opitutus sp. ER46 TaxID=2161864 RepID=UPI0011B23892|nr:Do family serine endopeptidase [Opitutus sp. ER46]
MHPFSRRSSPRLLLALAFTLLPLSRALAGDALIDNKRNAKDQPAASERVQPQEGALAPGKTVVPDEPSLRKGDAKKPAKGEPADSAADLAKRAPLRLVIDPKPINRDAPDRVSYAPVVRRTAASVVFVYSKKTVKGQDLSGFLNDPMFRRFFDIPGHRQGRSGRMPDRVERGLGSGVVVSADGYILTNNHVISGADEVEVSIGESTKKQVAKVIGRDALADIAVLKIEPVAPLAPAVFGDSDQLQVGDVVLAIGNPFGIGQSVSRGIVSALSRGQLGIEQLEDFIQTDAAINPGNSGGALIDSDGRVVGINTAILSSSGGFNGVGFAIPANLVRFVAEQIVTKGRVERGFLGVSTQDLTEDIAASFGAERGALVTEVSADSPAEKVGLKAGDVITKVNGVEIRDQRHLQLQVTQFAPGTEVTVDYLRDGKPAQVRAKLGLRPNRLAGSTGGDEDNDAEASDDGVLNGVTVGDITPEMRDELQIPARIKGALITKIDPDSPSAKQGLREGDVILELDRKPTRNADEAVKLSEQIKGPKVMILIWRAGGTRFVVVDESKK